MKITTNKDGFSLLTFLILVALLLLPSFSARAVSTSMDLRSVSVADLSRVVLKEMLKADFVLSPEVLTSDARLSLNLSNQSRESVIKTLGNL
jgi:hypothetical protein